MKIHIFLNWNPPFSKNRISMLFSFAEIFGRFVGGKTVPMEEPVSSKNSELSLGLSSNDGNLVSGVTDEMDLNELLGSMDDEADGTQMDEIVSEDGSAEDSPAPPRPKRGTRNKKAATDLEESTAAVHDKLAESAEKIVLPMNPAIFPKPLLLKLRFQHRIQKPMSLRIPLNPRNHLLPARASEPERQQLLF